MSDIKNYNEKWIINHLPNLESISDLLGEDKSGIVNGGSIFSYVLPRFFGKLLDNDPNVVLSKHGVDIRRKYIHNPILKMGPLFLSGKKLIKENVAELPNGRPIIFAPNHGFFEDPMSSILMAERHAYLFFGSLPQFFNTFNGVAAYVNGSILINRKNKASRQAAVDKAVRVLELGTDLILYPEGVLNKSPNMLTLRYWPGIVKIAQKSNALIVPIVHLPIGNEIHSSRLPAFDMMQYSDEQTQEALDDLQTAVNTELWQLMEKHSQISRTDILGEHERMEKACEDIVSAQVEQLGRYYDYPIECMGDFQSRQITKEVDVWEPVAKLKVNQANVSEVLYAQMRVEILRQTDYQHRF